MFKSKSYNVQKESEKNDKAQAKSTQTQSSGTMTLKKKEVKNLNNYSPPHNIGNQCTLKKLLQNGHQIRHI